MSSSSVSSSSSSTSSIITPETIDTTGGLTTDSTLTNDGADGQLQLTGLASGIDTNELIQAQLAEDELPLTNIQDTITALDTENSTLSTIQDSLQTVSLDALSLDEPSLFFQSQTVSSSDSTLVSAAATEDIGAVIGSSTVAVTQLASASQATFDYTAPTDASDTLTITNDQGTQTVDVTAGESNASIASSINSSDSGIAYATVLSNGQLVISSRTTGYGNVGSDGTPDGNPITLSSSTSGDLTPVSSAAGQDAEVYVNGSTTPTYSATDTVTDAVPGVTLTLNGVTPSDAPVTITTSAPAPDSSSIVAAVQQFVSDYNTAITGIQTAINTAPDSESDSADASPYTGSLFGDPEMEDLLSNLRDSIDASDSSLASGYQSLADIGISTGASTGTASADSTDGLLTVDTSTLTAAIEADPSAVEADLASWSSQFQTVANDASGPFGTLEARITGNSDEVTDLDSQLTNAETMYNTEESNLEEEWANVESTLESLDDQKTSLTSFADSLSSSSSS